MARKGFASKGENKTITNKYIAESIYLMKVNHTLFRTSDLGKNMLN